MDLSRRHFFIHPRHRGHHGGKADGGGGEQDGVADFLGCAALAQSAAGVAVNGTFKPRAGGDGEFDECAGFHIERTGFMGGGAKRIVGGHDFGVVFAEFEETSGWLLGIF